MTSYHKYIVSHSWGNNATHDEYRSGNAFIIPNNYDHSLAGFIRMLKEARKSFPSLKLSDVECLTVLQSSWCKGCPLIRFPVEPDIKIEGWENQEKRLPDVVW